MLDIPVTLIRSSRKTLGLQVKQSGEVILRAPLRMQEAEIRRFLESKKGWVEKQLNRFREQTTDLPPYTPEDIRRLADEAIRIIPERVKHFAPLVGVTWGRITIRSR